LILKNIKREPTLRAKHIKNWRDIHHEKYKERIKEN